MATFKILRPTLFATALAAALSSHAALTIRAQGSDLTSPALGALASAKTSLEVRYGSRLGMEGKALSDYVASLHAGKLAQGGRYTVYSLGNDGGEVARVEALKKGEAVRLDASDKPVMLANGDPIAPVLLGEVAPVADTSVAVTATKAEGGAGSGNNSYLAALALIPPSFIFLGTGGDGGNGVGNSFSANPVPEPTAMAALGLGAVAILRRRKRA